MGIPQGTVLGRILFLVIINELCNIGIEGQVISFADDTVLFFERHSWEENFQSASEGMELAKKWLDHRKLSLNIEKTKYITFSFNVTGQPNNIPLFIHQEGCLRVLGDCQTKCYKLQPVKTLNTLE